VRVKADEHVDPAGPREAPGLGVERAQVGEVLVDQAGDHEVIGAGRQPGLADVGLGEGGVHLAGTGDVEFTAPGQLDSVGWRDAVSRVGLTVQERQLPRGSVNTAKIEMTPDQRAEWCQQVAIKLVEDAISSQYDLRGTDHVWVRDFLGARPGERPDLYALASPVTHAAPGAPPMLIVQDGREPDRRTVVVGDLRQSDVLTTLLSSRGIFPRQ